MTKNIKAVFVDMDGTLIDTDIANTYAYDYALKQITGISIPRNIDFKRITLKTIKSLVPHLKEDIYKEIKELKDEKYKDYLKLTRANTEIIDFINLHSEKTLVLVSKAHYQRVISTLKHHNLLDYFDYFYCHQNKAKEKTYNKYLDALTGLKLLGKEVLVFENEEQEINNALCVNIPNKNIIRVQNYE